MFYSALISLHHYNNDDKLKNFKSIAIYLWIIILLLIFASSPVTDGLKSLGILPHSCI